MVQQLGETREPMAAGATKYIEDFVSKMKHEKEPFYVVYCCREDHLTPNLFRQTVKAYRDKPPSLLGVLVWYVDNKLGLFEFKPELSAGWDIPTDPSLLSTKSEDQFTRIMERGQKILTA